MNRQQRRALAAQLARASGRFEGIPAEGDLFEHAKSFAIDGFAAAGGSFDPPAFIVDTEHGRRVTIAAPYAGREQKAAVYAALHNVFRDMGAFAYAQVAEAWRGSGSSPLRPSEDPDRTECLIVVTADRFGRRRCAVAEIKRSSDGQATLEPWEEDVPEAGPEAMPPLGSVFELLDSDTAH
jgi:hypothetical protein